MSGEDALSLLLKLPTRFEDWGGDLTVSRLQVGEVGAVEGEIVETRAQTLYGGRQHLIAYIKDRDNETVKMRFFNLSRGLEKAVYEGRRVRARGMVKIARAELEMAHPRLQPVAPNRDGEMLAIYPAMQGVSAQQYARKIHAALDAMPDDPTVPPPIEARLSELLNDDFAAWSTKKSLARAHLPADRESPADPPQPLTAAAPNHPALQRLRFEELLAHQIILRKRYHFRRRDAERISPPRGWAKSLLSALAFDLTGAQRRVLREILKDMAGDTPMRRLLQGDVGSGKTIVAVFACLAAARCGHTVAVMAPTEILAEQLHQVFSERLAAANVNCELLTGAVTGRARHDTLKRAQFGISTVVIGTHALFQEKVELPRVALTIVDEQHRFGVEQRRQFALKGSSSGHQLMMSATPIPRSLALSMYADMDISVLDEKPAQRKPIETALISRARRDAVLARVRRHIQRDGMVYWICPLVETSDKLELSDVHTMAATATAAYPDMAVGVLHGRMKSAEKKAVMDDFRAGKFRLLVATTVIEVGVDVAQADVMIVEHADRMGLAQLHQLRGRVGRGDSVGYCLLMYDEPLSDEASRRLSIMRDSNDGFEIAREDLLMRGPGEWLGSRQSGLPSLRIARLGEDEGLMKLAKESADWMLQHDKRGCVRHIRFWLNRKLRD